MTRPPASWSVLQTVLWVDGVGVACDLSSLVHAQANGSALLQLARQGRLAEVGVTKPKEQLRLARRLRAVELRGSGGGGGDGGDGGGGGGGGEGGGGNGVGGEGGREGGGG